jgi:hypothetical protein
VWQADSVFLRLKDCWTPKPVKQETPMEPVAHYGGALVLRETQEGSLEKLPRA